MANLKRKRQEVEATEITLRLRLVKFPVPIQPKPGGKGYQLTVPKEAVLALKLKGRTQTKAFVDEEGKRLILELIESDE